jgi:cell division FtsZ-interacting protein ZapD
MTFQADYHDHMRIAMHNRNIEIRELEDELNRAHRSLEVSRAMLTVERRRVEAIRNRIDDAIKTIEYAEKRGLVASPGFLCAKLRCAKDPEEVNNV